MKFAVNCKFGIEFLDPDDDNGRGIKTIRHKAVGTVEAENESLAQIEARTQIHDFINQQYPVRWNSGIYSLRVAEIV